MARIVTALFREPRGGRSCAYAPRLDRESRIRARRRTGYGGRAGGMPIQPDQFNALSQALRRGDHVVVATVARGADEARIVDALGSGDAEAPPQDEPKLSYSIGPAAGAQTTAEPRSPASASRWEASAATAEASSVETPILPTQADGAPPPPAAAAAPWRPGPDVGQASNRMPASPTNCASARRRFIAAVASARYRPGMFESRAPARRLTDEEVQAGGLLKDRVIEVVEKMREEPVISREVVVREEVVIRKTASNAWKMCRTRSARPRPRSTTRHSGVDAPTAADPARRNEGRCSPTACGLAACSATWVRRAEAGSSEDCAADHERGPLPPVISTDR